MVGVSSAGCEVRLIRTTDYDLGRRQDLRTRAIKGWTIFRSQSAWFNGRARIQDTRVPGLLLWTAAAWEVVGILLVILLFPLTPQVFSPQVQLSNLLHNSWDSYYLPSGSSSDSGREMDAESLDLQVQQQCCAQTGLRSVWYQVTKICLMERWVLWKGKCRQPPCQRSVPANFRS